LKHYYLMVIDKQSRHILEEVALSILSRDMLIFFVFTSLTVHHHLTVILALHKVTMLEDTSVTVSITC